MYFFNDYAISCMRFHPFDISQSVADDTFINCVRSVDHKLLNVCSIYENVSLYICEERKKEEEQPMCVRRALPDGLKT